MKTSFRREKNVEQPSRTSPPAADHVAPNKQVAEAAQRAGWEQAESQNKKASGSSPSKHPSQVLAAAQEFMKELNTSVPESLKTRPNAVIKTREAPSFAPKRMQPKEKIEVNTQVNNQGGKTEVNNVGAKSPERKQIEGQQKSEVVL